ncbi:hypothetical protein A7982_13677 [Minicystis rosea]|nr:hypothetical protein A7982_13677 [Minicystis rosea]
MTAILQQRLTTLKSEHETGQKMLAELDAKRANLTQTLLRIEGAIQVLRELTDTAREPSRQDAQNEEAPPPS